VQETLAMSKKETSRIRVLEEIVLQTLTYKKGSEILGLSERQLYRIVKRFKIEGYSGIIHRSRGKPSNHGYPEEIKTEVIEIYRKNYSDYGATLFSEQLEKRHSISINNETIRRWLRNNGINSNERKKRPHRKRRERKTAIGEMVQFDGSHHDWFEGRGEKCCLFVCIDDASSRTYLMFSPTENTESAMRCKWEYIEKYGIANSLYTDRHSVYYEEGKLTDFGKALLKLGIKIIYAKSPQAKGRVERNNRTYQDRLIKELRRLGISTIDEANKFLRESFIDELNAKFSVNNELPDIHRKANVICLKNVFCHETERQVKNDYTITINGQYIQLEKSDVPLPAPKQDVIIRKYLDDTVSIFYNEQELKYKLLKGKPKKKERVITKPGKEHPWRKIKFGKTV